MRLLIVSVDFLPKVGGISLMTHHLANAFADAGHDVVVIGPNGAMIPPEHENRYTLFEDRNSNEKLRETSAYISEIRRIKTVLGQLSPTPFDHVILMHVFYYGWPVCEFCRSHSIPFSVFVHGFEFKSQLQKPQQLRFRLGLSYRPYVDLRESTISTIRLAKRVFVNSSFTGALLLPINVQPVIVGCGVPLQTFRDQLRAPTPPSTQKTIGFLGRIVESKNVDFLIGLLPSLGPDFTVKIAGAGDCQALQRKAQELRVEHQVVFLGPVTEDQKWEFLAGLDALCLPSKLLPGGQMEGFGIVLIEATVKGTPVIVSTQGGMSDFALDHNGLYIDIDDLPYSATTITEFLNDPAQVMRTVDNAQRLVKEQLTYDRICNHMLAHMTA